MVAGDRSAGQKSAHEAGEVPGDGRGWVGSRPFQVEGLRYFEFFSGPKRWFLISFFLVLIK